MASKTYPNGEKTCCLSLEAWENKRLRSLAEQLQYFKPMASPWCTQEEDAGEKGDAVLDVEVVLESAASDSYVRGAECRERRAAVLICLYEGNQGELRVILTKRSNNLSTHPGEVALPGGKREEGDVDDSATALREAMEEIGLDPSLVCVVAFLEPFISKHLLRVTPVVGLLSKRNDFKPVLNANEVDAVFDVPLEMFLKEENHRCEEREWMGWQYIVHFFDYESDQGSFLIWGLTAGILIRAASVIYQRPPPFTERLPDFQEVQRAYNFPSLSPECLNKV